MIVGPFKSCISMDPSLKSSNIPLLRRQRAFSHCLPVLVALFDVGLTSSEVGFWAWRTFQQILLEIVRDHCQDFPHSFPDICSWHNVVFVVETIVEVLHQAPHFPEDSARLISSIIFFILDFN